MKRLRPFAFPAATAFPFLFALLSAALGDQVHEPTIDNPGGYVLASDAENPNSGYNRDAVQLGFVHGASSPGFDGGTVHYRYVYRLLDEVGDPVPVLNDEGTVRPELIFEDTVVFDSLAAIGLERDFRLPPGVQLDSHTLYQAQVTIYRRDEGSSTWFQSAENATPPRRLIHFTHTDSDDDALNVISSLEGLAIQDTTVVATVDGMRHFSARADLTLFRWDGFDETFVSNDSVTVHFDLELRRLDNGNPVPLEESRITRTFDVDSFQAGSSPREPKEQNFDNVELEFLPAGQLDSVATQYRLHVAVSHVDLAGDASTPGNDRLTSGARLLHFNGSLLFGNIRGQINGLQSTPVSLGATAGWIASELELEEAGGAIEGVEDIVFGDGSFIPVNLLANGDAEYTGGDPVAAIPGEGYEPRVHGGHRFSHNPIALTTGGASATQITLVLPAGAGILPGPLPQGEFLVGFPFVPFSDVELDQNMLPIASTLSLELDNRKFYVESFPVYLLLEEFEWAISAEEIILHPTGVEFMQEARFAYLEDPDAGLANPDAAQRMSNDMYFRHVDGINGNATLRRGDNGEALLNCELSIGPGHHNAHFPLYSHVAWDVGGQLHIEDTRIDPAASYLEGVQGALQIYQASCPDDDCGGASPLLRYRAIVPDNNLALFTPEGGLHATGDTMTEGIYDPHLEWGMIPYNVTTHETDAFMRANFYTPGNVLAGSDFPGDPDKAPGTLLLSGVNPDDLTEMERPGETAYKAGLGDYPGLNFRVDGNQGESKLGGEWFSFALSDRSKYYARWSGVSGIHEAASFDETREIYGYPFAFSNFGLSFLAGVNHDSRVNGEVTVPYPSDFTQEFENMTVTCLGALDEAQPPEDDPDKTLVYWGAVFSTYAIQFEPDPDTPCAPEAGFLTLGVGTEPGSLATRLYGTLGFFPDGELIAPSEHPATVASRLIAPQSLEVAGPGAETYRVTPVADLYFNSHHLRDQQTTPEPAPFLSLAAGMNVPFFEQIQAQLHLSPLPGAGEDDDIFERLYYVMGGWPDTDAGWTDGQGRHFFSYTDFDGENRGYPDGETLESYRDPTRNDASNTQYLARAQKQWLGVIPFDYPLKWTPVNRAFRSPQNVENDLLVLQVEHQVLYLDPNNAEISFGAQYDGLPQINVANMLYDAVDEQLGAANSLVNSAGQAVFDRLLGGVDGFARILDDKVQMIFRELFDEGIDPLLDELAAEINAHLASFPDDPSIDIDPNELIAEHAPWLDAWDDHIDQLETELAGLHQQIREEIAAIAGGAQDVTAAPVNLIGQIDDELARVQDSIRAVLAMMPDSVAVDPDKIADLLPDLPDGQAGRILEILVGDLISKELPNLAASLIEEPLEELMERAEPTLAQIAHFLDRIDDRIGDVRDSLQEQGQGIDSFAGEIRERIAGAQQEIENIVDTVFEEAFARLQSLPRNDYRFDEIVYDPDIDLPGEDDVNAIKEELKTFLRETFEDVFFESDIVRQYHRIVRQRIYDIYLEKQEAVDTVFAQVNDMVKEIIRDTVGSAEDAINEVVGDLSEKIGAGEITGHAHIQGEALRLLRLDGHFQFQVPDEMELRAYLQIKQLRADGTDGCIPANGDNDRAVEATIGAIDIPLEWLAPDLRADVETRFSFDTGGEWPVPRGLAGSFALTGGTIGFESFEINQLAAAMAFSASGGEVNEAYLSAAVGLDFNDYAASGGVFFGRACSLHPIQIWDPDVAAVLNDPPFTGVYVYGEVWMPVSEALLGIPATCMFRVSAGVGAGMFYFVEGPTYGGKLFAGLSGDILCLVSVAGELTMIGVKQGGGAVNLTGLGFVEGKIGVGRFGKTISRDVVASYIDGSWDVDLQ